MQVSKVTTNSIANFKNTQSSALSKSNNQTFEDKKQVLENSLNATAIANKTIPKNFLIT